MHSSVDLELDLAIVCTSLQPLEAFVRCFGLGLLRTARSGKLAPSSTHNRNSIRSAASPITFPSSRVSRKRPGQPDEESEIDGIYLELFDGKIDQDFNMTTKLVDSHSSFAGNNR